MPVELLVDEAGYLPVEFLVAEADLQRRLTRLDICLSFADEADKRAQGEMRTTSKLVKALHARFHLPAASLSRSASCR